MNKAGKTAIVVGLVIAVVVVIVTRERGAPVPPGGTTTSAAKLPRFLELGSVTCIPCKMMAPILEELRQEYAGRLQVDFIDTQEDRASAGEYKIKLIPTQILFDASGKELFRHEGFFPKADILAKWKELGYDFAVAELPKVERWEPLKADRRPRDKVCYMCDGDINPKTLVMVRADKGDVRLCSPHCYFIMYSALTEDKDSFDKRVSFTDYSTGKPTPATQAACLCGLDGKTGRLWVRAFADRAAAEREQRDMGGSILGYDVLRSKELSSRCGFCDRAVHPEDASLVKADGVYTWGCCPHCALGVAARTGKDIEVHQPDALTGGMIVVKTLNGNVASLEPTTAIAWFGMRKKPDGKWGSAGCFHQANFVNVENLKKWLEQHPLETGKLISIQQALADKMKMTPRQIQKACKIGECAPK